MQFDARMNDEFQQFHYWLKIDSMQMRHADVIKMGFFMQGDEVIYDVFEQIIHPLSLLLS